MTSLSALSWDAYPLQLDALFDSMQSSKRATALNTSGGVCHFYLSSSSCIRGASCPYKHHRSAQNLVCKHYLRGLCKKGDLCVAAGTSVTVADQTAVPIEHFADDRPTEVLSYDPAQGGCVVKRTEGQHLLDQGVRQCVELVLEDGRKLVCTPDHRVRTRRGDVEVQQLLPTDRVLVTAEGPRVQDGPVDWALEYDITHRGVTSNVRLDMSDRVGHARALAFARVLGYILTDGSINVTGYGKLYMGHMLDVQTMRADIGLILGVPAATINFRAPAPHAAAAVGGIPGGNTYDIDVPKRLVRVLHHFGCPMGKKLGQGVGLPAIITHGSTPLPFKREFLGALFGGDGGAPVVEEQTGVSGWSPVAFHTAVLNADRPDARAVIEYELKPLLSLFGVDGVVREEECKSPPATPDSWMVRFLCSSDYTSYTLDFAQKVGFRHCVHKVVRLAVAASWYRGVEARRQQRVRLVDAVNLVRAAGPVNRAGKTTLKLDDVVASVLAAMKTDEVELSGVVPEPRSLYLYLSGAGDPAKSRKTFYSPQAFVNAVGAAPFFNAGYATTGSRRQVHAVPRHLTALPVWDLGVAGTRPVGLRATYDLSVEDTHLFVAEGIVVHNCEFVHVYDLSRMPTCQFFLAYGECGNPDCNFLHVKSAEVEGECEDYARGFCAAGVRCDLEHVRGRELCADYLAGFCPLGPQCPQQHPKYELDGGRERRKRQAKKRAEAKQVLLVADGAPLEGEGRGYFTERVTYKHAHAPKPVQSLSSITCNICQEPGHFAAQCPQRRGGADRKLDEVLCFRCGEKGHYANVCPNQRRPGGPPAQGGYPPRPTGGNR